MDDVRYKDRISTSDTSDCATYKPKNLTIIKNDSFVCVNCSKGDVCKFKDDVKTMWNDITQITNNNSLPISAYLTCKYYDNGNHDKF